MVGWLASRQTADFGDDEASEDEEDEDEDEIEIENEEVSHDQSIKENEIVSLEETIIALPGLTPFVADSIPCAGFNGRYNKLADTCYSFWNGATLLVRTSEGPSLTSTNCAPPRCWIVILLLMKFAIGDIY